MVLDFICIFLRKFGYVRVEALGEYILLAETDEYSTEWCCR